jgi:hypothetical protein
MVRRRRRSCLAVVVAAAVSSVLCLGPAHAASPGQPIALGAEVQATGSQTQQQAITAFEATIGHKLAFTRDYLYWDSPFPTSYEQWLAARGTMPMISVKPKTLNGVNVSWASIAAAQPGDPIYARMTAWADEVKAFGAPVYFTFNHEPESVPSNGSGTDPATYIAAWQNFHNVFAAEGVTNAKWIWIMTSYAFIVPSSDPRYGWKWYPGDAYVDAIGADAYTFYTCNNNHGVYHTLAWQISGFLTFGSQHPSEPMWLPEWGVIEDSAQAGHKAQWISDAQALFKGASFPQFAGIGYFNLNVPKVSCDWRVSTSASAQAAYNALAQDPFYSGSAYPPASDATPPSVSITSPAGGSSASGTMTVNAAAGDDVAVAKVGFSVDGAPVLTDTAAPYTASIDTTTLSNGPHSLTAVATDTSNNSTTSAPVSVTVSNVAPTTSCPATPAGSTELSGNLSLEVNQTGWTGVYSANSKVTRVAVSGGSYDGSSALQIAAKPGTTGAAGVNNVNPYWVPGSPGLSTTAGKKYTGGAEVQAGAAGQQVSLLVRETTPSGTGVSSAIKTMTLNDTAWHPIATTYTAKNAGDAIRYSLYGTFTASSQPFVADCLSLQSTP